MKILYHHRVASKDGQFVHITELTRCLYELGHELTFVAPNDRAVSFGGESGLFSRLRRRLSGHVYEVLELAYCLVDFAKLCWALSRSRPDVIYERYNLFLPSGIWAGRLFGVPLILEVNAPLFAERTRHDGLALKGLARWSERYVWRNADAVLPVTRVLADMICAEGVENERVSVIHNGVSAALIEQFSRLVETGPVGDRPEAQLVLGFVGFVREWHGLDRVISLMEADTTGRFRLLIIGDGPARSSLERQAERGGLQDRLTITGLVGRDEVASHVAGVDVALQPDVVPYASPLKMFEYMAAGKAILAIDSPNIREILDDENDALLFDADREGHFEAQLKRLLADPDLRESIGRSARQRILDAGFLWSENARKVEGIAERLTC